ncbi:MAG: hypothetical protein N4A54_03695 [Peptostreptococcaceae bacterium]|jgi:hypothetical protein|nr:hypothetical protein [Peptostreptococcaceae bacterium]
MKKKFNKHILLIAVLSIFLLAVGINQITKTPLYQSISFLVSKNSIYDDDKKIANKFNSYNYTTLSSSEIKNGRCDYNFGKFSGMDTIFNIECKENETLHYDFDLDLKEGDFKVVLIDPDDKVIKLVDKTGKNNSDYKTKKGNYRIKFVGRDASAKITFSIKKKEI